MHTFIVLLLAVTAALADRSGYNYNPNGHSIDDLSSELGPSVGDDGLSDLSDLSGLSALSGLNGLNGKHMDGNNLIPSGVGGEHFDGDYDTPSEIAPSAEFEKEFYTFTAPENEFDDPLSSQKVANSLRKGLRVVFIKGPENRGLENAALSLAKQAAEQRTAIYVLNKQTDIGDLANKLNAIRSDKNNKPEVHFVKYRTPEDAADAQRAIQSQYDDLAGKSRNLDGGVAPVINFASRGPVRQAIARQPDNSYLPSSIFRRRF